MPASQQQRLVTASVFININELHDTTQEGFFPPTRMKQDKHCTKALNVNYQSTRAPTTQGKSR